MRVVICPDKFAGTISAVDAAAALAEGWRAAAPDDEVICRPLADGGPGFLEVLAEAVGGQRVPVPTVDPLGRPVPGWVLVTGATAYVESAQACGLHLLAEQERDPKRTTSYGLGMLLTAAVETGARRVVIGLGGSATNDAGAGMLAALGAVSLDAAGRVLPYGGAALIDVARLGGSPWLRDSTVLAATDVDSPLAGPHGASLVYAEQKGARTQDLHLLDEALVRFASVLERDLPHCPAGMAELPGAGSAGGLGAAILAIGGRCESGVEMVRRLTGLEAALSGADLVITGEGSFDHQSLRGKVVAGVARAASQQAVACVVVAGRVRVASHKAAAAGIAETHALVDHYGGSVETAMRRPAEGLRTIGEMLARKRRH